MPKPSKFRKTLIGFLAKIDNLKPADRKALAAIKKYQGIMDALNQDHSSAWDAYDKAVSYCVQRAKAFSDALEGADTPLDAIRDSASDFKDLEKQYKECEAIAAKLQKIEKRIDQLVRKDLVELKKEHPINELHEINF